MFFKTIDEFSIFLNTCERETAINVTTFFINNLTHYMDEKAILMLINRFLNITLINDIVKESNKSSVIDYLKKLQNEIPGITLDDKYFTPGN